MKSTQPWKSPDSYKRSELLALRFANSRSIEAVIRDLFQQPGCDGMPLAVLDARTLLLPRSGEPFLHIPPKARVMKLSIEKGHLPCGELLGGVTITVAKKGRRHHANRSGPKRRTKHAGTPAAAKG